jgi:hypothetical protein
MNKRIRELYNQSLVVRNDDAQWIEDELDPEKFAQLIAKECADICLEMAAKCGGIPGDGALAKDCAYWIKKDFGVEE